MQTFDENSNTDDIYKYTVMPLVAYAFQKRGRGTCIAYGQTGSGKSFTISAIQQLVARDVFRAIQSKDFKDKGLSVHVSFLEIYGARCSDLLHSRNKVIIREDGRQRVVASGLEDVSCDTTEELLEIIARGQAERVTHATEVNSQSSRSHSICEIVIKTREGRWHGSLSLVDLAGSERAADSRNHNRQLRLESAEINKSLLALKECIRSLAMRSSVPEGHHVHIPFRASKLTLALRDSFTSENARVCIIATVSPNASSADHTQNTLRYADRVKEKGLAGEEPVVSDDEEEPETGRSRQEVTFSFLQTAAVRSADNFSAPRMSPLTIEEEVPAAPPAAAGTAQRRVLTKIGSGKGRVPAMPAIDSKINEDEEDYEDEVKLESEAKSGDPESSGFATKHHASTSKSHVTGPTRAPVGPSGLLSPPGRGLGPAVRTRVEPTSETVDYPEDNVEVGKSLMSPPPKVMQAVASTNVGGFRKLLQRGAPSAAAPAASVEEASVSNTAAPARDAKDLRNKLRERGKIFKAPSGNNVLPPMTSVADAVAPASKGTAASNATFSDDEDDNIDDILGRAGLPSDDLDAEGRRHQPRLVQSFLPLPSNFPPARYPADRTSTGSTGSQAKSAASKPADKKAAAATGAGATKTTAARSSSGVASVAASSSPQGQRDLALVHTLRRGELRSRGGEAVPEAPTESVEDSALLQFHETAGVILDEEEDLLNAHMSAIQENAELLSEEGQLLAEVQNRDAVEYDIDSYASKLQQLLNKKIHTTHKLLKQLAQFREHLKLEEHVSKQVRDDDLRLA